MHDYIFYTVVIVLLFKYKNLSASSSFGKNIDI